MLKHLPEFIRVGLSVRISLEHIVGAMSKSVAVEEQDRLSVSSIGLRNRLKMLQSPFLFDLRHDLVCVVLASIVGNCQNRFARFHFIDFLNDRIPLSDGLLNVFCLVVGWHNKIELFHNH